MGYIFIHGLGQTPESWNQVTALLPSDVQICRPCLAAIAGDKQMTYENLYQAFESECNRMETPLWLCGISLGAVVALQYALNHPEKVRSLMLIAPQYKMPKLLLAVQSMVFRILPKTMFYEMGFSKKDMITLTASMKRIDLTPLLHEITCPSFILCGQKDKANKNAAKMLARLIPNAKLSFVDNAGHEVNIDAPSALADLIKEAWFHGIGG